MPEAVLEMVVREAFGGSMRGVEGVVLPRDRHGNVDL
jgi:hypothetical protein